MTEQRDRVEQAFKDAFARHADDVAFEPLRVDERAGSAPRSWGWGGLVSGVAAIGVLVALVAGVLRLTGTSPSAVTAAPASGEQRPEAGANSLPPSTDDTPLPRRAGSRWISYRDAMVEVPSTWGDEMAPGADWCAGLRWPQGPFVDTAPDFRPERAILCSGTMPAAKLRPYVTFGTGPVTVPPLPAGWRAVSASLPSGTTVVVVRPDDQDKATKPILESLRTFTTDENGCAPTSPIQSPAYQRPAAGGGVAKLAGVDRISVCLYDLKARGPGLLGSRALTESQAPALIAAIGTAPLGSGPNHPDECVNTDLGNTAVVLRFWIGTAVTEAYLYYENCTNNGLFDAVETWTLTRSWCAPLFGDRVRVWSGWGQAANLCWSPDSPTGTPTK